MIFKAYLVLWVQSEICGCGFRKELVAKQFLLCGGLFCCFDVGFFVCFWGLVWFVFLIMLISRQVSSLKLSF